MPPNFEEVNQEQDWNDAAESLDWDARKTAWGLAPLTDGIWEQQEGDQVAPWARTPEKAQLGVALKPQALSWSLVTAYWEAPNSVK